MGGIIADCWSPFVLGRETASGFLSFCLRSSALPLQEDYQVTLDTFHGPMDLLLYLIQRAEVDIHDIPIATITDQYLSLLSSIDDVDVEVAGEFLVMAATLIEIKSRMLMPPDAQASDAEGDGGGESATHALDPRHELVQQLLAYQKYRIAAEELDARRQSFADRFAARPSRAKRAVAEDEDAPEPIELDLEDVHVFDLSEAYERIMASIDLTKLGDHTVEIDETPIALHQEDLLDRLRRAAGHRMTLQEVFDGRSIGERVGLFLAMLELVRTRRVTVEQESINDPIALTLNEDPEDVTAG
jgi:segregation and condensation protein A